MPPIAGDITTVGTHSSLVGRRARAQRLGFGRVLQDQRALDVPGAVQPGGQSEMAFEQRADVLKEIENASGGMSKKPTARFRP